MHRRDDVPFLWGEVRAVFSDPSRHVPRFRAAGFSVCDSHLPESDGTVLLERGAGQIGALLRTTRGHPFRGRPYRDLVYDPCETTPICARIRKTSWIYQGSFSKSLAPGLRLGFLAASPDLVPYLVRLKQAADLHSNRISQWLVLKMLEHPERQERVGALRDLYLRKRDDFSFLLEKNFSDLAAWEVPKGGLFSG